MDRRTGHYHDRASAFSNHFWIFSKDWKRLGCEANKGKLFNAMIYGPLVCLFVCLLVCFKVDIPGNSVVFTLLCRYSRNVSPSAIILVIQPECHHIGHTSQMSVGNDVYIRRKLRF